MNRGVIFGALVVWVIILLFFRSHRNWLPYYVLGSVGLAFALIGVGRLFFLEQFLQVSTASSVHLLSAVTGVETRLFPAVPGALMVLVIPQNLGWTVLNIGLESSGLLEIGGVDRYGGVLPWMDIKAADFNDLRWRVCYLRCQRGPRQLHRYVPALGRERPVVHQPYHRRTAHFLRAGRPYLLVCFIVAHPPHRP